MKPFLSVIIPTLNEEKYLPNLLNDLSDQTYHNFEVIVVDGNSDDHTSVVASEYKNIKVLFFQIDKRNVAAQRNFGAQKAKGQYLFFIDADTRMPHNAFLNLKKEIKESQYLIYLPHTEPEGNQYVDIFTFNVINYAVELSQYTARPFSSGGSLVVERTYFDFLGGFNPKLYLSEDHELVQRARKRGVKAKYLKSVPCIVSLRRLERESMVNTMYKYSVAFLYTLAKGGVDKKIIDYEMGGDVQKKPSKKQFIQFRQLYEQLKRLLEE